MPTISLNKFNGGHAEDLRTFTTDQCEESLNFDLFTNPHYLQPYADTITETVLGGTVTDFHITDIIDNVDLDAYVALGQAGDADTNIKFFSKSTVSASWTQRAEDTAGVGLKNSLVGYKGLAYGLKQQGSDIQLLELTNDTTITVRGTISNESSHCRPYIHPEDNILYGGCGDTLWSWDGTTFNSYTSIIPTGTTITSLTDYGSYLAVAVREVNGIGTVYLWGRDGTLNTTQGIVNFGKGNLNIIENIGELLIGVLFPTSATSLEDKMFIKIWYGGQVETLKEISVTYLGGANPILKAKSKDRLYFITGDADCIYVVTKNKNGAWSVSKDRYVYGGTVPKAITGLSVIDDIMWVGYIDSGSLNQFYRTNTANYTNTSIYKSTINPAMPLADRYKLKQLEAVQISYTGASSGNTGLKYSVDGSDFTTIISDTNATGEHVTEATHENDGTVLLNGREFQFQVESTGGAKIKEVKYKYSVLNTTI